MARVQSPRVLYFLAGSAATDEELKESLSFPGAAVSYRNASMMSEDAALEEAEFVAGRVPERYLNARSPNGEKLYQTLGNVKPLQRRDNTVRRRQRVAERYAQSLRAMGVVKQPADGKQIESVTRNRRAVVGGGNRTGADPIFNEDGRDVPTADEDPSGKHRDAISPIGDATTNVPGLTSTAARPLVMPGSRTEALLQQGEAQIGPSVGMAPGADVSADDASEGSGTPLPPSSADTDQTTQQGAGSETVKAPDPKSDTKKPGKGWTGNK